MGKQLDASEPLLTIDLFSGMGAMALGCKLAGINTRTVLYVEWSTYCQRVIKQRISEGWLDDAPLWGDISTLGAEQLSGARGMVGLVSAGFPCPAFSVAGLRRGALDSRNLFPDTLRIIKETRPKYVLLENVRGILSASGTGDMEPNESELGHSTTGPPGYAAEIIGELADAGYDCRWCIVSAADAGAPQKRERWFCWGVANGSMADPIYDGSYRETGHEAESGSYEPPDRVLERGDCTNGAIPMWPPAPSDRDGWARLLASRPDLAPAITEEVESALLRAPDGRSYRVDQLKSIGNLVVPATVALALSILAGGERMPRRRPPLIHG